MYIYSKRALFAKRPFYPTVILRVFYGNPTENIRKEYVIGVRFVNDLLNPQEVEVFFQKKLRIFAYMQNN